MTKDLKANTIGHHNLPVGNGSEIIHTGTSEQRATSTFMRVTRVMIVDDHELIRDGLRQLIGRQPHLEIVAEAASEREAKIHFRELQPELVIIDLALENSNGLDLIKWIRHERPPTKMVVVTMYDERDYGERALRAGALGFVNKQSPARAILTAIASVLEGNLFFSETLSNRILRRTASNTPSADDSPLAGLSDRELEIFNLIGADRLPIKSPNNCTSAPIRSARTASD